MKRDSRSAIACCRFTTGSILCRGGGSFVILLLSLMVIGLSVEDGAWVPVPGLQSLFILSAVVGVGLAKVRITGGIPPSDWACNWGGAHHLASEGAIRRIHGAGCAAGDVGKAECLV